MEIDNVKLRGMSEHMGEGIKEMAVLDVFGCSGESWDAALLGLLFSVDMWWEVLDCPKGTLEVDILNGLLEIGEFISSA